jgi:hypothetical protein
MPYTSMAVRATPRIAAFSPGASPPDVKIPRVLVTGLGMDFDPPLEMIIQAFKPFSSVSFLILSELT